MEKIQILDNIDNLIMQGEEVLKTKRYHNYEIFAGDYVDTDLFNEWKCQIDIFLSTDSKFKTAKDSFDETVGMSTNYEYSKRYISILKGLKTSIENNIIPFETEDSNNLNENTRENCIFIGHGRSKLWKEVALFLRDDLNLSCVKYFEKDSQAGRFIGDALRDFQNETTFAIIVMTAEDETKDNKMRTRQNVVHETGFFQGKLGFEKVAILRQEGVETFSNIDGLQYISFSGNNISQTFYELQKMLKREKII